MDNEAEHPRPRDRRAAVDGLRIAVVPASDATTARLVLTGELDRTTRTRLDERVTGILRDRDVTVKGTRCTRRGTRSGPSTGPVNCGEWLKKRCGAQTL